MWVQSLLRRPLLECHSNIFDFASRPEITCNALLLGDCHSSSACTAQPDPAAPKLAAVVNTEFIRFFSVVAIVMPAIYNRQKGNDCIP